MFKYLFYFLYKLTHIYIKLILSLIQDFPFTYFNLVLKNNFLTIITNNFLLQFYMLFFKRFFYFFLFSHS